MSSDHFLWTKVGSAKALETWKTRSLWGAGILSGEVRSISTWRKTLAKKAEGKARPSGHSSQFAVCFMVAPLLLVPLEIYRSTSNWRISHFEDVDVCGLFLSPYSWPPFSILPLVPEACLTLPSVSESSSVITALITNSRYLAAILSCLCQGCPLFSPGHRCHTPSLFIKNLDWVFLSTQQPSTFVQVLLPLVWTVEPTPNRSPTSPSIHPPRDCHKINLPIAWFPSVTLFGEKRIP